MKNRSLGRTLIRADRRMGYHVVRAADPFDVYSSFLDPVVALGIKQFELAICGDAEERALGWVRMERSETVDEGGIITISITVLDGGAV